MAVSDRQGRGTLVAVLIVLAVVAAVVTSLALGDSMNLGVAIVGGVLIGVVLLAIGKVLRRRR